MTINGFWLILVAIVFLLGLLVFVIAFSLIVWMLYEFCKQDHEQKKVQAKIEQAQNEEYEA